MALFSECTAKYAPILLDTADIVRDGMLHQRFDAHWTPVKSIGVRLRRWRERFIVLIRAERVAQKTVDPSSQCLNKLRIGHLGIIPTHPSVLNTTAAQFSKNRLSQPLAIEKRLAMGALQPGQRLFRF
ncbi:MAG TPA: hypothetical protein VFF64_23445 [Candidatus Eremiobacteraceae bacterium]|nr:hypothetical protein [Candidatus Eremiobacteraceae bacterium]